MCCSQPSLNYLHVLLSANPGMPKTWCFQLFCDKFGDGNKKWEENDAIDAFIDSQLLCVCLGGEEDPSASDLRGTPADLLLGILACALQMEVFPPLIRIPFMENSSRACTSHLQHSYCLTVLFCSSPSAQHNPDCLLQC